MQKKTERVHSGRIVIMLRQLKGNAISALKRLKALDGFAVQLVDVDYDIEILIWSGLYLPKILAMTAKSE